MKKETKEVAKRDTTALDISRGSFAGLMDETPVESSDFLIPKILLMQSMSTMVQEEKARAGEIRGSVNNNKLAEKEGNVEIIAFKMFKTWVTISTVGNEYLGQVPFTPENCLKAQDEVVGGVAVKNFKTLNYFCIVPSEIAGGVFMPYVVSFRSTSYKAGKALETIRGKLQGYGKPLPFVTINLGSVAKENDKGKFFEYTVTEGRETTDQELTAVKKWFDIINVENIKVDDSDLDKEKITVEPKVAPGEEY